MIASLYKTLSVRVAICFLVFLQGNLAAQCSVSVSQSVPSPQCSGSSVVLTANATGTNPITFAWSNGATTAATTVTRSGLYRVTVTATGGCTASASSDVVIADYIFNGTIAAGDLDMTGRLTRDGSPSSCGTPKACPGTFAVSGVRDYDVYTFVNRDFVNPVCATAHLRSTCSGAGSIFSVAYSGSFDPANLCANYLADLGSSPDNTSGAYSFNIPAGGTVQVVVHSINVGGTCGDYTLSVDIPRSATGISLTGTACAGSLIATVSPLGESYLWSTGSVSQSIVIPVTDAYQVTVNYGNHGCLETEVASINVNPLPAVAISGGGTYCGSSSVVLDASGGATYLWTNGETTSSLTVTQSGVYTLTATDHGCTATASEEVIIADYVFNGSIAPGDLDMTGRLTRDGLESTCGVSKACPGVFTNTGIRDYDVYTFINNNFTNSVCATVHLSSSCAGNSVIFSATYSGSFNPNSLCTNYLADIGSSPNNNSNTYSFTIPAGGQVQVVVSAVNTGATCGDYVLSVDVPRAQVSITQTGNVCAGSVFLSAEPNASSYLWSNGATAQTIVPQTGGLYEVVSTFGNVGCTDSASIALTLVQPTAVTITGGGNFCGSQSVVLTATEVEAYQWSNGATTQSITVNQSGVYSLTATNFGCTSSASTEVVIADYVFNGSIAPGDLDMPGRLTRDGLESVCGVAKACPGVFTNTGIRDYDVYTFVNNNFTNSVCATVHLSSSCAGNSVIFSAAYSGSFDPNSLCTNYLADIGSSPNNSSNTYSFTIPAGGQVQVVVSAVNTGATCGDYVLSVDIPHAPASIVQTGNVCAGGVFLSAEPNAASYLWSNGATAQTIVPPTGGLYEVVSTFGNVGCTDSASIALTLVQPTAVTITGGGNFCGSQNVVLTATEVESYQWSNGATTQSITVNQSGVYSLTATNFGCTSSASTEVVIADYVFNGSIAPGDLDMTGRLTRDGLESTCGVAKACPGVFTNTGIRDYDVYTFVNTDFTNSVCATVHLSSSCAGNSVIFSTAYSGSFNPNSLCTNYLADIGSSPNNSSNTYSFTIPAGGQIQVVVSAVNTGATCGDYVLSVDVPRPATVITTTGGPCANTLFATATGGGDAYLWSTGATAQTIVPATSGVYSVTITNGNIGCTTSASTSINVNPLPTVNVTGGGNFCGGSSVVLTASGANGYVWSTGETTASITVTQTNVYTVTGTTAGCTASASDEVVIADIVFNGSIVPGDLDMAGRLTRDGLETTCGVTKACPGIFTNVGVRDYDVYTITNPDGLNPVCATVHLFSPCTGNNVLFSTAYLGTFNPGSLCTNYLADIGSSPNNSSGSYSFEMPAGATVQVVVSAVNTGATCNGYTISIDVQREPTTITTNCSGTIVATANPVASSYLWSTGATTRSITLGVGGVYSVTTTHGNACTEVATANIDLTPNPAVTISGGGQFCGGSQVVLTASGTNSYLWSTGQTTQSITVTSSGFYSVTGSDYGCTASAITSVAIGDFVFNGSIAAGDLDMLGRLTRDGVPSTCAASKSCPGIFSLVGTRDYDVYTFTNTDFVNPACATVFLNTACGGANDIFVAAYSNSFNAGALCTNYLADMGNSANGASHVFSFEIPAGGQVQVVVHALNVAGACGNYTLTVDMPRTVTEIFITGTTCAGSLIATAQPTGVSYLWSTGAQSQSIALPASGTYTVTVTYGNNGCTASASANAVVTPSPTVSITGGGQFCGNSEVTLSASGGQTYLWSNGETTQSITAPNSGTYRVTATADGCTATASTEVAKGDFVFNGSIAPGDLDMTGRLTRDGSETQCGVSKTCPGVFSNVGVRDYDVYTFLNPSLIDAVCATVYLNSPCAGNDVLFSTAYLGVFNPNSLCSNYLADIGSSPSNGSNAYSFTIPAGGQVQVVVSAVNTGAACGSYTLVVDMPQPVANIITTGGACAGSLSLFADPPATSYLWSTGATTQTIVPTESGNYSLTLINGNNGCTTSASLNAVVVPTPVVSITGGGQFCSGTEVVLTANGSSFAWSTGETTASITPPNSGVYVVTATENGCTATASTDVAKGDFVFNGSIAPGDLDMAGRLTRDGLETQCGVSKTCPGVFTNVGVRDYDVYTFLNPSLIDAVCATVYLNSPCAGNDVLFSTTYLGVFNPNSLCTNYLADIGSSPSNGSNAYSFTIPAGGQVQVVVSAVNTGAACGSYTLVVDMPQPVANIITTGGACAGSLSLFADPPATSYLWSTGATTQTIVPTESGNYTLTLTNGNNGCTTSASLNAVVVPTPVVSITGGGQFCSGTEVVLTANGSNFAWSTGETTASITPPNSGVYVVTVTENGCTASASTDVAKGDFVFNGSIAPGDLDMAGRLTRDGLETQCGVSKTCPGVFTNVGTRDYDVYTFVNPSFTNAVCATVHLSSPCAGNDVIFSTAYTGTFDPNSLCTNYLADIGSSPSNGSNAYSFTIPAGGLVQVVVSAVNTGAACGAYTLVVDIPLQASSIATTGSGCEGSMVASVTPAGASYLWNTGETTQAILPTNSGLYSVSVANGNNGCISTASINIVTVPAPDLVVAGTGQFCSGEVVTLSATGADQYAWSTGETVAAIIASSSGLYTLQGTNTNSGCTASTAASVIIGDFVFNGSIEPGDLDMTGRLTRDGLTSTCASPKSCPGIFTLSGTRDYDVYTFVNTDLNNPVCATAHLETNCSGSEALFSVAYLGSFSPGALCGNYLADMGSSPLEAGTYSFTIPPAGQVQIIVHAVNPGAACNNYTLSVDVPHPAATIAASGLGICNGPVTLTASVAQSYLWSTGQTTQSISVNTGGNYSVSVGFGNNGCQEVVSQLIQNGPPVLIEGSPFVCAGGQSILSASTGVAYLWSNGDTNQSINVGAGTYSVTVTDNQGCTGSNSFTVSEFPAMLASAQIAPVTCFSGADGAVDVTVQGGLAPFVYQWEDGPSTEDRNNLTAGTYRVTVTDANGCVTVVNAEVLQPDQLVLTTSTIPANCNGADGRVGLNIIGGTAPYLQLWSNGATTQNNDNVPAGTYSVTVTDVNGCVASAQATVLGALDVTPPSIVCPATQTLTGVTQVVLPNFRNMATATDNCGSVGVDQLSPAPGTVFNTSQTVTVVLVADDPSGNTSSCSFEVVVDITGCNFTTSIDPAAAVVCAGNTTILTATNGSSWSWSTGETTQFIITAGGSYTVTVTDGNGCTASATATVTEVPLPSLSFAATDASCGLPNGAVDLTVTGAGGFVYNWSDGSITEDISNLTAGTYSVTAVDANGCASIGTATVGNALDQAPPSIACPSTQTLNGQFSVTLPDYSNMATASDNCGAVTVAQTFPLPGTIFNNNQTVTVTLTATDGSGNVSTCGFDVVISIGGCNFTTSIDPASAVVCAGNTTILTATNGSSWSWSTGETTQFIITAGGSYTVTVTDGNGCTASATATVTEVPLPSLSFAVTDASCGLPNGAVDLTVTGGFVYNWSDGSITEDISNLTAGTYSVTAVDANGCASIGTATVGNALDQTPPSIACPSTQTLNGQFSVTLPDYSNMASASDNCGAVTVAQTFPLPGTIFNNNQTVTVTLTATDGSGNVSTCLFEVNISIGGCNFTTSIDPAAAVVCAGNTTILTATNGSSWSWSTGETTQFIAVGAGNYTVTVSDGNGCSAVATASVTEDAPMTFSGIGDGTCAGQANGAVSIVVTGGTSPYLYDFGFGNSTNNSLTGLFAGTYTCTVTDAIGCAIVATAVVPTFDSPTLSIVSTNNTCPNGADGILDLTASGGAGNYVYNWSNGEVSEDISNLTSGTYTVTVSDGNGCEAVASASVGTDPDLIAPVLTCPAPQTLSGVNAVALPDYSGLATATDNCGNVVVVQSSPAVGTVYNASQWVTVMLTATDDAGNVTTCAFDVDVTVAVNCPPTPGVIFVDDDATGANDGSSWANAYTSLQSALSAAVSGNQIWVAEGTYKPGISRTTSFAMKAGVSLYGGFPNGGACGLLERDWVLYPTNLSGDIGVVGDGSDNSSRVVQCKNIGNNVRVDGFIIRDALSNSSGGGIGITADNGTSSPVFEHCVIRDNYAPAKGAGCYIYALNSGVANPRFRDCQFVSNVSTGGDGAALATLSISGGSINASLDVCSFDNNNADQKGGGIANTANVAGASVTMSIDSCTFNGNVAGVNGGAIYNYSRSGSSCVVNITATNFTGNSAQNGSAVYSYSLSAGSSMVTNIGACAFNNNTSLGYGPMCTYGQTSGSATTQLEDCTFMGNTAGSGGGVSNVAISVASTTVNVNRCRFEGNTARGGGLITTSTNVGTLATTNVRNSVFYDNTSPLQGGAVNNNAATSGTALTNLLGNTFHSNQATTTGGVVNNNAASAASTATVSATNCIFWDNPALGANAKPFYNNGTNGSTTVTNCVLDFATCAANNSGGTGTFNCAASFSANPLFANAGTGDLHPLVGSPAIDAGANVALVDDYDGNGRPVGAGYDIGAFEYQGPRPVARLAQAQPFQAKAYPNPTNGLTTLTFDRPVNGVVEVSGLDGKKVSIQTIQNVTQAQLDLHGMAAGVYFVRIVEDSFNVTIKVVLGE